jgi:hypothetical protein
MRIWSHSSTQSDARDGHASANAAQQCAADCDAVATTNVHAMQSDD